MQWRTGNDVGYAIVARNRTLPGGDWAAWLAALALPFVVGPTTTLLILLFPDGRLPSPRWRPVLWFAFSALGVWAIALASLPGKFNSQQYTSKPLWDPDAAFPIDQRFILPLVIVLVFPAALLCAAGLVSRFRQA